ncbi:MAG: hypothetical protein V9G10_15700 [Candidatus Nanopelagicales bacterium]
MKLVCIGDSFTEGLCDVTRPDGEYLGWADRVAAALAPVEYANLAVRGKLFDQILADQVPVALATCSPTWSRSTPGATTSCAGAPTWTTCSPATTQSWASSTNQAARCCCSPA